MTPSHDISEGKKMKWYSR